MKNFKQFPWYPLLFAVYPALELTAHNLSETRLEAGVRPVLISLLGAAFMFGLLRLLLKNVHRAAFLTAAWFFLFAAYGHVHRYFHWTAPWVVRTPLLEGAALLLAAAALFAATRPKVRPEAWTAPLNAATLALLIFPVWQIVTFQSDLYAYPETREIPLSQASDPSYPDIYYIILDSYTRADTLQQAYGYDNSAFLAELEKLGFVVADCSMTNYRQTKASLSSSLNMAYLTRDLDPRLYPESRSDAPNWNLILYSEVMKYVKARGYKTVAFATSAPWSEWTHADAYFAPPQKISDFEILLLETTAFKALEKTGRVNLHEMTSEHIRANTRLALETLSALPAMDLGGPKFVFAHILPPHPPFVFAEDGSPIADSRFLNKRGEYSPTQYAGGYTMQVTFINRAILQAVKEILANSAQPPIIILQGDHGPWFLEPQQGGLAILNAYHLPGHTDAIDDAITPVNTFRLIFNLYLGGSFDLLPDQSYYLLNPPRYEFEPVANTCAAK